jgi:pentose-5-phosphate-3-epimerase
MFTIFKKPADKPKKFASVIQGIENYITQREQEISKIEQNKWLAPEEKGIMIKGSTKPYLPGPPDKLRWITLDTLKKGVEGQKKRIKILENMQKEKIIAPKDHAFLMEVDGAAKDEDVKNYPHVAKANLDIVKK